MQRWLGSGESDPRRQLGGDGWQHYQPLSRELLRSGYRVETKPKVIKETQLRYGSARLQLTRGRCYAVAIGAGRRISVAKLLTSPKVSKTQGGFSTVLRYCARRSAPVILVVRLATAGSFTWALFSRVDDRR